MKNVNDVIASLPADCRNKVKQRADKLIAQERQRRLTRSTVERLERRALNAVRKEARELFSRLESRPQAIQMGARYLVSASIVVPAQTSKAAKSALVGALKKRGLESKMDEPIIGRHNLIIGVPFVTILKLLKRLG